MVLVDHNRNRNQPLWTRIPCHNLMVLVDHNRNQHLDMVLVLVLELVSVLEVVLEVVLVSVLEVVLEVVLVLVLEVVYSSLPCRCSTECLHQYPGRSWLETPYYRCWIVCLYIPLPRPRMFSPLPYPCST
jgi:hypothetical protein